MKYLIPAALLFFGILSITFFDGWPFSSSESPAEVDSASEGGSSDNDSSRAGSSVKFDTNGAADSAPMSGENPPQGRAASDVPNNKPATPTSEAAAGTSGKGALAALRARIQNLKTDRLSDAYRVTLSQAVLSDDFPTSERLALLSDLRDVNHRLVRARARTVVPFELVEIKSGDNLTRIARRIKKKHGNNVTPAMIMFLNRMKRDVVQLGQKLAVPTESITVMARKSDYRLYVLLGSAVVLDYEIGLGRNDSTPEGSFLVRGKAKNPAWTKPDQTVVAYGDPDHTIGNRWMGLDDLGGRTGYGIHGTVDESSIGQSDSDGCIRLRRADVEALFRIVPEGAKVEVRR